MILDVYNKIAFVGEQGPWRSLHGYTQLSGKLLFLFLTGPFIYCHYWFTEDDTLVFSIFLFSIESVLNHQSLHFYQWKSL